MKVGPFVISLRIMPAQQLMTNIEGKPERAVKQSQIRRRRQPGLRAIDKLPVVDRPAWSHVAQLGLPRPDSTAGVFPARNTEYLYALGFRVIEVCEF